MAEEIAIDNNNFFNRLSNFYASWKADKRSGNALFGNAGSIVILMGKTDEENSFQKNNAMHVCDTPSCVPSLIWDISGALACC
jgi:Xaa-Pro aminopeptidase